MRYRTRRAIWQVWARFWGLMFAAFWPAALPLGSAGKGIAVAAWLGISVPAAVAFRRRKRTRWLGRLELGPL